jgi:hypothetical protein
MLYQLYVLPNIEIYENYHFSMNLKEGTSDPGVIFFIFLELLHTSVGRSDTELTACETSGRTELSCRSVPSTWHFCAQLPGEVTMASVLGSAVLPGPPEWCK